MRAVILLFLCVGLLPAAPVLAEENGFAHGNQLYAAGKYAESAAAYETQVKRGEDSADLFYNLGDAYYRLGNRGRAILNYRRALTLEPSHAEAAANLAFVGGGRPATGAPGVEILSWLTAAAGWLAVAAALTAAILRPWRATALALTAAGLLGVAAGAGALWWLDAENRHGALALVVADTAPALYSPADNSKAVTTLAAGTEVRILSAQGAWTYAQLNDGTRAWVSSGKVERLIPPG